MSKRVETGTVPEHKPVSKPVVFDTGHSGVQSAVKKEASTTKRSDFNKRTGD